MLADGKSLFFFNSLYRNLNRQILKFMRDRISSTYLKSFLRSWWDAILIMSAVYTSGTIENKKLLYYTEVCNYKTINHGTSQAKLALSKLSTLAKLTTCTVTAAVR